MITIFAIGIWQLIFVLLVFVVGVLPTILALIDIIRSEFQGNNKIIWVVIVLFFNFFGAIIYFLFGRQQRIK